jgi:hypothetical protein
MTTSHGRLGLAVVIVTALMAPAQVVGQVSNTNPTGLFVYAAEDQKPEQQQADEMACYGWAGERSQFDPIRGAQKKNAGLADIEQKARQDAERIQLQADQQAQQIQQQSQAEAEAAAAQGQQRGGVLRGGARGAAVGAVGGAIAGDAGKGAAIGATTGGMVGGMKQRQTAQQSQQQAEQAQQQGQQQAQMSQQQGQQQIQQVWQQAEQQMAKVEGDFLGQIDTWERAYTVCLEGRGYGVN